MMASLRRYNSWHADAAWISHPTWKINAKALMHRGSKHQTVRRKKYTKVGERRYGAWNTNVSLRFSTLRASNTSLRIFTNRVLLAVLKDWPKTVQNVEVMITNDPIASVVLWIKSSNNKFVIFQCQCIYKYRHVNIRRDAELFHANRKCVVEDFSWKVPRSSCSYEFQDDMYPYWAFAFAFYLKAHFAYAFLQYRLHLILISGFFLRIFDPVLAMLANLKNYFNTEIETKYSIKFLKTWTY